MAIQKNEVVSIEITGLTAEGSGVGRADGMAVFVPGAAIGDQLRVKIIKRAKNYAFAKIEEIDTPSPDRIPVDCPQYSKCGGCVYRHISYEAELRAKEQRVRDAIVRIGGFSELPIRPIVGAEKQERYRNKAQLPIGKDRDGRLQMGFFAPHSHRIVPCEGCLLQPERFDDAMKAFQQWAELAQPEVYDEQSHKGRLRHFYLRSANATGELMACVVVNANGVPKEAELVRILRERLPELTSVVINSNREKTNVILGEKCRTAWGKPWITDQLCGLRFHISPLPFYQVNRDQAERLYGIAGEYAGLDGQQTVLDLYCGTGTIGLTMAHGAKRVIGVEVVPQAVENAKENAALNGIDNAEFLCADAAQAAQTLERQGITPDVVVLDPPRKGCDAALIETVARMRPKRVVYVSCDPATLARDLKRFDELGYRPQELTPVDLFPRTAHCEVCVKLNHI